MNLRTDLTHTAAATWASEWVDLRNISYASLQVDVGDVASPVGAVTIEFSNDFNVIEKEKTNGIANTASTAAKVDVSAALTITGTALALGYDGIGAKASYADLADIGLPAYARVVFTRASGTSADTFHVRFVGR